MFEWLQRRLINSYRRFELAFVAGYSAIESICLLLSMAVIALALLAVTVSVLLASDRVFVSVAFTLA